MTWTVFFSWLVYFIGAATAFAITYATLKLKIIEKTHAERLALEQEKTAKERDARERAEARNAKLLAVQDAALAGIEKISVKLAETEKKADDIIKASRENSKELEKQAKIAKKIETKVKGMQTGA